MQRRSWPARIASRSETRWPRPWTCWARGNKAARQQPVLDPKSHLGLAAPPRAGEVSVEVARNEDGRAPLGNGLQNCNHRGVPSARE
eukprot:12567469-Alexandrium_andersonii.AAC.1